MQRDNDFDGRVFLTGLRREAREIPPAALSVALLRHLLTLKGEEFVRQSYMNILHRPADEEALSTYGVRSVTWASKIIILAAILLSPERVVLPSGLLNFLKKIKKLLGF